MSFKQLFSAFISGQPIKRKDWGGYWIYKHGHIIIITKENDIIDFRKVEDLPFTISQMLQDDWEIATNENCDIEVK